MIFEAPTKAAQSWFIKQFGPDGQPRQHCAGGRHPARDASPRPALRHAEGGARWRASQLPELDYEACPRRTSSRRWSTHFPGKVALACSSRRRRRCSSTCSSRSSRRRGSSRSTRTTSSRRPTRTGARSSSATARRSRSSPGRRRRRSRRPTARRCGTRSPTSTSRSPRSRRSCARSATSTPGSPASAATRPRPAPTPRSSAGTSNTSSGRRIPWPTGR